jgi:acetolactate synthase-1/2/3 large subunit
MNVAEYIADYLSEIGVTHVFGVTGGMCMHLVDAFHKHPKIEFVQMLHEQSAGIAADAYSQITGKLGVCLVTAGPGATNAVTSCAASYIDSTPVLYLSGQCKSADSKACSGLRQKGVQEVDIIKMVRDITKMAVYIGVTTNPRFYLEVAVKTALDGRKGPVWLDIPLDVQERKA